MGQFYEKSTIDFKDLKVAVLAVNPSNNQAGGAERLYQGLLNALKALGCLAELVSVSANERSFDEIVANYERIKRLDLSRFDVVISTKAPTYAIDHSCHVMYLVHTVRVFDDMFYQAFPQADLKRYFERKKIHDLDFQAISRIKARFSIGYEVSKRLYKWQGLESKVLHPPLAVHNFRSGQSENYFFLPGRLHPWKRVDLVIEALQKTSKPFQLIIAGTGEVENELKIKAGDDPRIKFIGRVSDEDLIKLYSGAIAIPFAPIHEDYGYVTLEAFASAKAVITCKDSGEPTHFVNHGETGLICEPNSDSFCAAMEWLYDNRQEAQKMGERGQQLFNKMPSWQDTVLSLLESALKSEATEKLDVKAKVTVLDMQPIDPPVGGGRLRLLGLYHKLENQIKCQYIGSYDWPGESYRQHYLSDSLQEIDVPLSDAHHAAAHELSCKVNGKTVIDISFPQLGYLSKEYLNAAKKAIKESNVIIFSHPWVYPLVAQDIKPSQIVVYDSQNVEGYLRSQMLDESNPFEANLLRQVVEAEYDLGCRAELILSCSQEDLERFNRVYDFPLDKVRVVPNGVMAFSKKTAFQEEKAILKSRLMLSSDKLVAIFIGSAWQPNLEAGRFIINHLADSLPDIIFVIAGGVGTQLKSTQKNVVITGPITEEDKIAWLSASDIAINPMFSGSGTNIKMFDFMAMSLPIVTTPTGARGIETSGQKVMIVAEPDSKSIIGAIEELQSASLRAVIGHNARICVEENYSWERISPLLGKMLDARHECAGQPQPVYSVIVPTYERHSQLKLLMGRLQKQVERDFEVIIVDQSKNPWSEANNDYGFPLTYFHSPVKGAVRARNIGATIARGKIIAFVDDDCLPAESWLLNARKYFSHEHVVAVEGLIISDHLNDPDWRPVTNVNFEGIGFMTANLIVRSCIFQKLGGFDLSFDKPHFREDTDLGWRLQNVGEVPYAEDVIVFHPAQPRTDERESLSERATFFQKDALLYNKHPENYKKLFFLEQHFKVTPGFADNLLNGFNTYDITVPDWIKKHLDLENNFYE